jgi:hypothetical protein
VHFIALDDVEWTGPTEGGGRGGRGGNRGSYRGGLGADQLEFIKNDLALVPEDQLLVLFMHIPLTSRWNTPEREALYRIIERRPLTFSVSAHTHYQAHQFLTEEDGWRGVKPHHHLINVTVCGSWWSGEPDELGIPIATMSHGAPNGYSIVAFDSAQYSVRYKASRRPEDYQMNVFAPNEVAAGQTSETEVLVNVFAGSERSTVEMRLGAEGAWRALERVRRPDPYFVVLKEREAQQAPPPGYRRLPDAANSLHLWRGVLPADLAPGVHLINVRTTDMFGQTYSDHRLIRVAPNR